MLPEIEGRRKGRLHRFCGRTGRAVGLDECLLVSPGHFLQDLPVEPCLGLEVMQDQAVANATTLGNRRQGSTGKTVLCKQLRGCRQNPFPGIFAIPLFSDEILLIFT